MNVTDNRVTPNHLARVALCALLLAGCEARVVGGSSASPARAAGWSSERLGGLNLELYKPAFVPPSDERSALIVLHGCAQTAQDIKSRGNWDEIAETFGMTIVMPNVPGGGKYMGCWDYYGSNHTRTNRHNDDLLALASALASDADLDISADQIYISGLSSGGGMAMVMGCLAPDVFAGVGVAAGPTIGTSAAQISYVATNQATAVSRCTTLAGSAASSFSTQLASVIAGTRDYTVAQGYSELNALVFSEIYGDAAGEVLAPYAFEVDTLHGYQPSGTGFEASDSAGPRVSRIVADGMGHAWPAGTGSGPETAYVASQGVDYGWYLAEFFSRNNRRTGGFVPEDLPENVPTPEEEPEEEPAEPEEDPEGAGCYVATATDDINGHLSRYDVYPLGYGVADETYVDLIDQHGVFGEFTLYQSASNDWFADPTNVSPCP